MNLVVFDVDGTLLDNIESEDECYARTLMESLGIPTPCTDWSQYTHVSDQGIAVEAYRTAFGSEPPAMVLDAAIDYFVELLRTSHDADRLTSTAGAAEMLRDLPGRGWSIGIATGAWRRAAEFKLEAAGLSVAGLPMATSEDGPARTGIVSTARARAERLHQAVCDRIVVVGDAVWDVEAARSLDIPFVGVAVGERADRLRAIGASTILRDFADLSGTLTALENARRP